MITNIPSQAFAPSAETMAILTQHPALNFYTQVKTELANENDTNQTDRNSFPAHWTKCQPKEGIRRLVERIDNKVTLGYIDEKETKPCHLCQNSFLVELLHLSGLLTLMKVVHVVAPKNGAQVIIALETTDEALKLRTPLGHACLRMTFRINHFGHQILCVAPTLTLRNGVDLPLAPLADGALNESLIDHTGTLEQAAENVLALYENAKTMAALAAQTLASLAKSKITYQEFFDLMKFSYRKMYECNHHSVGTIDAWANKITTSLVSQNKSRPPKTLLEALSLLAVYLDIYQPVSKQYMQRLEPNRDTTASKEWGTRLMGRFLTDILALRAANDAYCMGSLDPCSTLLTWVPRFHDLPTTCR